MAACLPPNCVLCGDPIVPIGLDESWLCHLCMEGLQPNRKACARCAMPIKPNPEKHYAHSSQAHDRGRRGDWCRACADRDWLISRSHVPLTYNASIQTLILAWKLRGKTELTEFLAKRVIPEPKLLEQKFGGAISLVPVTSHWLRRLQRGYDQTWLLANSVAAQLNKSNVDASVADCLRRDRYTKTQRKLALHQRHRNMAGTFSVKGTLPSGTIVLVDDVLTSGATANAAAEALLLAGAKQVNLWALARAV